MAALAQLAKRSGSAAGNQDTLKADIQELLKELSGELKDLQAQLASSSQEPHPQAGTSTDPELYGPRTTPEQAAGESVAIQLKTDTQPTQASRRGGGVGQPSGEVSGAGPQVKPEDAQLSEAPLEEQPVSRQPVPPEYRRVFDRLHAGGTPPEGTTQ